MRLFPQQKTPARGTDYAEPGTFKTQSSRETVWSAEQRISASPDEGSYVADTCQDPCTWSRYGYLSNVITDAAAAGEPGSAERGGASSHFVFLRAFELHHLERVISSSWRSQLETLAYLLVNWTSGARAVTVEIPAHDM